MLDVPLSVVRFAVATSCPQAVEYPSISDTRPPVAAAYHTNSLLNPPKIRHHHVANVTRWRLRSDMNAEQQGIQEI